MSNRTIVVTRPDPAGSELCRVMTRAGYLAIHFPTIAFGAPTDITAMENGIKQLGAQDWIIFVSPQAVISAVPFIRRQWPVLPPQVKFAAVGSGTAQALKEAGYHAIHPEHEWSAEGLLAMPSFKKVADLHIAIVRGEGGRELLEPVLLERDASVMSVITYRRELPSGTAPLIHWQRVDAIVCTSYSGAEHLKKMLTEENWAHVHKIPLIVVSERIKKLAQDLGFQTIWVAENASHPAIVKVIEGMSHVRQ